MSEFIYPRSPGKKEPPRRRAGSRPEWAEKLPSLGLAGFGLSALPFAAACAGGSPGLLKLLAAAITAGAVLQILAGLLSLRQAPLRASALTGYGLFWLSMIALLVLPRAGMGAVPGPAALAGYLAAWGLFGAILCQDRQQLAPACRAGIALLTLSLAFLAAAETELFAAALPAAQGASCAAALVSLAAGVLQLAGRRLRLPLALKAH